MPQLRIAGPNGEEQWLDLTGDDFILGRDPSVAIPLQDRKVSRKHARIFRRGDDYYIEDLGSANGVLISGAPIRKAVALQNGTEMEIGPFAVTFAADPEPSLALRFSLIGINGPVQGQTYQLPIADVFIGRGDDCEVVVRDASISRQHAVLEVNVDSMMIEDLGSSNGTFVNGTRVAREPLQDGDHLKLGTIEFEVAVEGGVPSKEAAKRAGPDLVARLRHADSSVKVALAMGVMTIALLVVVVVMLLSRGVSVAGPEVVNPFDAYEKAIEIGLANARAQLQGESWNDAVRLYEDVLEQDPINSDARLGLHAARSNAEHKALVAEAEAVLRQGRADEAMRMLSAIPGDAFYARRATEVVERARAAIALRAAEDAKQSCRRSQWRSCHESAILALTHAPNDGTALGLVNEAEKHLKAKKMPYTPWLP